MTSFDNQYEKEVYDKSHKKLMRFQEVNKLVAGISDFTWNLKCLYLDLQRNVTNNNFVSRKMDFSDVAAS